MANYHLALVILVSIAITWYGFKKHWTANKKFFIIKILISYFLGLSMLSYGLTKILQTQFVMIPSMNWQLPLEKLPGTAVAWAFLGHSSWFQVLLGFLEFIPALSLLFRRTSFLGSILMLPMTLNVLLVNHALNLWSSTKELSLIYLSMNVILLLLEWKRIQAIVGIVTQKVKTFRSFKWEVLVVGVLVTLSLFDYAGMLWNYRSSNDFLTGDWFHKQPNEWVLQSEERNDSVAVKPRVLKLYFGPDNRYASMSDTGVIEMGKKRYLIDDDKQLLKIFNDADTTYLAYEMPADSLLQIVSLLYSLENITLTQIFRKRIIKRAL